MYWLAVVSCVPGVACRADNGGMVVLSRPNSPRVISTLCLNIHGHQRLLLARIAIFKQ